MFRKRGRPPDPPLQIGGYDRSSHDQEINQIPGHQIKGRAETVTTATC